MCIRWLVGRPNYLRTHNSYTDVEHLILIWILDVFDVRVQRTTQQVLFSLFLFLSLLLLLHLETKFTLVRRNKGAYKLLFVARGSWTFEPWSWFRLRWVSLLRTDSFIWCPGLSYTLVACSFIRIRVGATSKTLLEVPITRQRLEREAKRRRLFRWVVFWAELGGVCLSCKIKRSTVTW